MLTLEEIKGFINDPSLTDEDIKTFLTRVKEMSVKELSKKKELQMPTIKEIIKEIKKSKAIDISEIKNSSQITNAIGKLNKIDMSDLRWHGGGSSVRVIDLTSQCDGLTKTFTSSEKFATVLSLTSSSFPFTYRNGIDFTWTTDTITLTSEVIAPETTQTLIALVVL